MSKAIVYFKSDERASWSEYEYDDDMKAHDAASEMLLEGFIVKLVFND